MSFMKYGDGKIVSVLDEDDLTDEQKKALKDLSKEVVKTSKENSQNKIAGR